MGDVGIINYLLVCSICVTLGIPFASIMPLFYADPWAAIVGRNVASPKLVGDKSVAGTLAVFATAAVTVTEASVERQGALRGVHLPRRALCGQVGQPGIAAFCCRHYAQ